MLETYSVFAKFRHRRLTLRRRIPSLSAAIAFAGEIRRIRFHDPESVFVVRDRTGELVEEVGVALRAVSRGDEGRGPAPAERVDRSELLGAEQALERTIERARAAQRAIPALRLDAALHHLQIARGELAHARSVADALEHIADEDSAAQAG